MFPLIARLKKHVLVEILDRIFYSSHDKPFVLNRFNKDFAHKCSYLCMSSVGVPMKFRYLIFMSYQLLAKTLAITIM